MRYKNKVMLQKLLNILYRYPKSKLKNIQRMGGWRNVRSTEQSRLAMEQAAITLNCPQHDVTSPELSVWFLTGKKFWYQTIFCIKSLIESSQQDFLIHICDDGSLDAQLIDKIRTQVPFVQIHTKAEIEARLEQAIPRETFPHLWHKRTVYPHIKKLTDVHIGTTGWKLVLDSDMLFFQRPDLLISWLKSRNCPFYIQDTQTSYGYSLGLMNSLTSSTITEKVNVGAIGLRSETINWLQVENWIEELEAREGTSYYLEQALSAMLIAGQNVVVGPKEDYIVMPTKAQVEDRQGVLHHYVDTSKEWYFKRAWKHYL